MTRAFLPDFELALASGARSGSGATPILSARTGRIVAGELLEVSTAAATLEYRICCTVILADGSCATAVTSGMRDPPRSQRFAAARTGTCLIFQAADLEAQQSDPPGIFVYGTLMRGEVLGHVLAGRGSADVQPATVRGQLRHLGDYPGLVLSDRGGIVHGELVVPADPGAVLPELDEIECARPGGEPGGLYRRSLMAARLRDGRVQRAWVYVIDAPGTHPIIRSGSWRDRS